MLMRSLISSYSRKSCCNTLFYQIRYASNKSNQTQISNNTIISKLQNKFPRFTALYSLIIGGFRAALNDFKTFVKLANKMTKNNEGEACLSVEELLFYFGYKQNIKKLLPLAVLGILPGGNFLIVPLVYFFPRRIVTTHFWNENQKIKFPREEYEQRVKHHQPILNQLVQCRSSRIPDDLLFNWRNFLKEIQHGKSAQPSEILEYSKLFHRNGPYYLQNLPTTHILHLNAAFGLHSLLPPLKKSVSFANYNLLLDQKIKSLGGPQKLTSDSLHQLCFMRGVNAMDMKEEEKISFLEKWLIVNEKVDMSMFSLLFHTPLLLGYGRFADKSISTKS